MISAKKLFFIGTLLGAAASVQAANMRHAIETQDADTRLLQEEGAEMSIPSIESQGMLLEEDEQFLVHHDGDATVCNKDGSLDVISNTYLLYKVLLFKGAVLCKDDLGTCEEYKCFPGSYKGTCVKGFALRSSPCDDGNGCTVGDSCDGSGNCLPEGPKKCIRLLTPCVNGATCNSATGECEDTFSSAGTSCNDQNDCTTDDKCDGSGNCAGSSIVVSTCVGGEFTFTSGTSSTTCTPFGHLSMDK